MTTQDAAYALYADDYQHVDGIEDVTYTPKNPSGAAVSSVKAKRGDLNRKEISLGGNVGIEPTDIVFTLYDTTLSSNEPKGGDQITDADAVAFTIRSATKQLFGTKWRCVCYRNPT